MSVSGTAGRWTELVGRGAARAGWGRRGRGTSRRYRAGRRDPADLRRGPVDLRRGPVDRRHSLAAAVSPVPPVPPEAATVVPARADRPARREQPLSIWWASWRAGSAARQGIRPAATRRMARVPTVTGPRPAGAIGAAGSRDPSARAHGPGTTRRCSPRHPHRVAIHRVTIHRVTIHRGTP